MNRYELTDEVKQKWLPIISNHIEQIENNPIENDLLEFDLSDTELNPYTLWHMMESELGFTKDDQDDNGWQLDFWLYFTKPEYKKIFTISGTGITFELKLEEHDQTKEERDKKQKENDKIMNGYINDGIDLLKRVDELLKEDN